MEKLPKLDSCFRCGYTHSPYGVGNSNKKGQWTLCCSCYRDMVKASEEQGKKFYEVLEEFELKLKERKTK